MKMVKDIEPSSLLPLIDKKWLFTGLWKLKGDREEGEKVFARITKNISEYGFEPKFVFDLYSSKYDGKNLNLCLGDKEVAVFGLDPMLLKKLGGDIPPSGKAALLCATVGDKVKETAEKKRAKGNYTDYFYLMGLAAAMAEALTEYANRKICDELRVLRDVTFRVSPGYPVWPKLADQQIISNLLSLDQIGVSLSESKQLIPEFSTTSLILTNFLPA